MATRNETTVVYAAGVVQGIVLVTFPAASTIFTNPAEYDLSSTQYGALFLPQVAAAITAALLGAGLGSRLGIKRVYLVGLAAGLLAMALLIVSSFHTEEKTLAYGLLLLATASLGAGFGLTVPALNTFTGAAARKTYAPQGGEHERYGRYTWRNACTDDQGARRTRPVSPGRACSRRGRVAARGSGRPGLLDPPPGGGIPLEWLQQRALSFVPIPRR
ncbi:MAG: hypothetical protein ABWY53_11980 [Leifsonia flava]